MIADNKIFSLGIENLETLNSFLEELQGDLDVPGFDEEILKQMVSEAEGITEKLSEYGTLEDDKIQSIKENARKKEQQLQRIKAEREVIPWSEEAPQQKEEEELENTEERAFVICTKCGEKIWL